MSTPWSALLGALLIGLPLVTFATGSAPRDDQKVADTTSRGGWKLIESTEDRRQSAKQTRRATLGATSKGDKVQDLDKDGVADDRDRCLGTPSQTEVDKFGCPKDSDGDGVSDLEDLCPGTVPAAFAWLDGRGCPVDTDLDGVPDYLDRCRDNAVGAEVDSLGCPVDSDNDSIPDGLDDCPMTLPGMPVDRHGCVDLSPLAQPMILHIEYAEGSFEVDPANQGKLKRLAQLLSVVTDVRVEVNAYTDDIGSDAANKALAQRRANRVKDFLAAFGLSKDRITAVGWGEENPVAGNATPEGRARNRRIELQFLK